MQANVLEEFSFAFGDQLIFLSQLASCSHQSEVTFEDECQHLFKSLRSALQTAGGSIYNILQMTIMAPDHEKIDNFLNWWAEEDLTYPQTIIRMQVTHLLSGGNIEVAVIGDIQSSQPVGPSCLYPPIYCPIPSTFQLAVLNNEKYPLIFTSGILGKNNEKLENKIAQTGAALDNLESVLRMSKSSLNRILRLNIYIKDKEFMDDVFTELKQRFQDKDTPAVVVIFVKDLPLDADVMLDAIATEENRDLKKVGLGCLPMSLGDHALSAKQEEKSRLRHCSGVVARTSEEDEKKFRSAIDELDFIFKQRIPKEKELFSTNKGFSPVKALKINVILADIKESDSVIKALDKYYENVCNKRGLPLKPAVTIFAVPSLPFNSRVQIDFIDAISLY